MLLNSMVSFKQQTKFFVNVKYFRYCWLLSRTIANISVTFSKVTVAASLILQSVLASSKLILLPDLASEGLISRSSYRRHLLLLNTMERSLYNSYCPADMLTISNQEKLFGQLLGRPENNCCADCGSKSPTCTQAFNCRGFYRLWGVRLSELLRSPQSPGPQHHAGALDQAGHLAVGLVGFVGAGQ